ncbi:Protein geranylgeranyltransferase type II [Purpureocillium takamizusanense]|uniref:Geranylgeranyl transferase type-2 subunit alpha n=1 Tax=Purpureocillium takamizusanense TaxID=2060973 RepID=A0A9Q8VCF4_9HYPO|nr:Protein geranylgeranyltransferase type II [Purpureocillium takamizusanense]UNI19742.1 Protein geranylgeranyltransferase type II [Purpureocillium takamizusanense]
MNICILSQSAPSLTPSWMSASASSSSPNPAQSLQSSSPGGPREGSTTPDNQALRSELSFTVPLLVEFPKCYWIWKYRLWILAQAIVKLPVGPARAIWQDELGLVTKMLDKDGRNFHAWGYRRHVVAQLESPILAGNCMVESEFEYTTKMISRDLSNFSAWHNRSQLIPRLLNERGADDEARRIFLETELDLVNEGLNVGPEDQSLWYYHEFLVSNVAEARGIATIAPHLPLADRRSHVVSQISNIRELLEDYDDIKTIYEALINYTILVGRLDNQTLHEEEKHDVQQWLGRLKALDSKRNGRWIDLEGQLSLNKS